MKVVVTGGTGFLGHHVQNEFSKHKNIEVFYTTRDKYDSGNNIYCDLVDYNSVFRLVNKTRPDAILHMAAKCGGILANRNAPADFLTSNIKMGLNLFEAVKDQNPETKIYTLGTVCAYPKHCPVPFKEDDLWNGYPEETNAPYGHAKRTLLMLQNSYRQQYGIGGAHLIPVNLFGSHDHFDLTNSHVIPALIRKFSEAVNNEIEEVTLWGTGSPTREFLYAGDAAEAIVKAITNGLNTELPINLGTGADISIRELAETIAKLVGYKGKIVFDTSKPDGQPKRMLDVSRAKEMMGWEAKTNLLTGLIKTIGWYDDYKDYLRD